jgi:hypothetical protein
LDRLARVGGRRGEGMARGDDRPSIGHTHATQNICTSRAAGWPSRSSESAVTRAYSGSDSVSDQITITTDLTGND